MAGIKMSDTQDTTGPTEAEVLSAQLQVAEASIIKLKADVAGLEAVKAELLTLLDTEPAQATLSARATVISDEIASMEASILDIPEGLTNDEINVLKKKRQDDVDELKATHDKIKMYIRGDI